MKTPGFDITEHPKFKRLVKRLSHLCENEPIEFVTVALIAVYANCAACIDDDAIRRGIALSVINGISAVEFGEVESERVILTSTGSRVVQ